MATPRKVIRDYRFEPEKALAKRNAILAAAQRRYHDDPRVIADGGNRVIPPYYPRLPIPAGDPLSPSGTKVELSELADDVLASITASKLDVREADGTPLVTDVDTLVFARDGSVAAGPGVGEATISTAPAELREVVLGPFTAVVAVGTSINIQTGVYAGVGSPAPVTGDLDVTLPSTGALFKGDGRIEVHLNGQDLDKGDGTGNGVAEWVSSTQIKLGIKVKPRGIVMVRAPFPTEG